MMQFQFKIKTEDGTEQGSNTSSLNSNGAENLTGDQLDLKNVATSLQQSYLDALSPANNYAYTNVAAQFRAQSGYPSYYPQVPGMEYVQYAPASLASAAAAASNGGQLYSGAGDQWKFTMNG